MGRKQKSSLPITEELDFAYLLELMMPLHDVPQYSWLPELFSIIGHEKLILLCKYAGGESIKIPTIKELSESIEALQYFYNVYIKKTDSIKSVPSSMIPLVKRIKEIYDSRA